MRAGHLHRGLIPVSGLSGDAVQGQRSRRDGRGGLTRNSQPHEDRPPVIDQGDNPTHDLATLPVLGGEADQLVLQLVKVVLQSAI